MGTIIVIAHSERAHKPEQKQNCQAGVGRLIVIAVVFPSLGGNKQIVGHELHQPCQIFLAIVVRVAY